MVGIPRTWKAGYHSPPVTPESILEALAKGMASDGQTDAYDKSARYTSCDIPMEHTGEDQDGPLDICVDTCFMCGAEGIYDVNNVGVDIGIRTRMRLWTYVFHGRPQVPWLYKSACNECAKRLPAFVVKFRDIDELSYYVNNLERAIRERKRNPHHRSNSDHASECS